VLSIGAVIMFRKGNANAEKDEVIYVYIHLYNTILLCSGGIAVFFETFGKHNRVIPRYPCSTP